MAQLKLFISQAMSGRKESEVRAERWFYHQLTNLRFAYGDCDDNEVVLINQYDAPSDMPIFDGNTKERETKQSLWLLGRSIQMMRDADIIIMVGNPIESKGMMVEYEVIRQYKDHANWWFYTDKDMIDWCIENYPHEYLDINQTYYSVTKTLITDTPNEEIPDKLSSTWVKKIWGKLTPHYGNYIWSDGNDIYYSYGSIQRVLDKSTSTWNIKRWDELTDFYGNYIWSDGEDIYYSYEPYKYQYVLNKATSTWTKKTWSGLTYFDGNSIWTDGENIYYSKGSDQYVLIKNK